MSNTYDITIIGAGAAGLAAGIFAAEAARQVSSTPKIVLLDTAKTIGAKILVSGGGRCNVTHDHITPADFNGSKNIVRNILAAFDEQATLSWFASMGVKLKREETGKLFPTSDSARSVLNAMLSRCADLGLEIRTQHRVLDIAAPASPDGPFVIRHELGEILAHRVILATGGRSLPKTGSDGSAYDIVRRLGHTVTDTYPALVPLVLDPSFFHAQLSGLSHEAELTTLSDGKPIDRRSGSLLWTHFGISGPVVMDASRHWVISHAQGHTTEMRANLVPGQTFESLEQRFIKLASGRAQHSIGRLSGQMLPDRLAQAILKQIGVNALLPIGQLPREQRRKLINTLLALPLPILHDRGWNHAEVTAGGVPLAEINYRTLESRKVPRLHLIGEILDCDGRIGGFNFQWAWATAHLAGRAAAVANSHPA